MHPIGLVVALLALVGIAHAARRLPGAIEKEKLAPWQAWLVMMLALVISPIIGAFAILQLFRRAWGWLWFKYVLWKIEGLLDEGDKLIERDIELRRKEKADDGEGEVRPK